MISRSLFHSHTKKELPNFQPRYLYYYQLCLKSLLWINSDYKNIPSKIYTVLACTLPSFSVLKTLKEVFPV